MKLSLYPRLAFTGIRKNARLYVPYFFACSAMMMVFYITAFLANSSFVEMQPGGMMLSAVLDVGWIILTVFSAIFLFYTNSFLLKRRKTEFGLYNILGMGKNNLMMILICENTIIFITAFLLGTALGVAFSKLVEIMLITVMGGENTYDFSINLMVIAEEFFVFFALFGIILVNGMRQIRINDAIKLFQSDNSGEKPPKANWFLAVLGAVLLISGYVLANIVENWIWAILAFFCAVILVIAATYLLFISGSTIVCRLLKKNKKYYYKTNRFISVSQMDFRMKKNGAGLASICILATMALVTISTVSGLYFGSEQLMRRNYPRDMSYIIASDSSEHTECLTQTLLDTADEYGIKARNIVSYNYLVDDFYNFYNGKKLITEDELNSMSIEEINELNTIMPFTHFFLVPISHYNEVMGTEYAVNEGEALVLKMPSEPQDETYDLIPIRGEFHTEDIYNAEGEFVETVKWCDTVYLKGVGTVDDFVVVDGSDLSELENSGVGENRIIRRYAFINDNDFNEQFEKICLLYREHEASTTKENEDGSIEEFSYIMIEPLMRHYFGLDLDCSDETMLELSFEVFERNNQYRNEYGQYFNENGKTYRKWDTAYITGIYEKRADFYALYGGLFFLGILFCIVFIAATILIMYYKQITEGYEDKSRYRILQKVGMTKNEIRSTINSQVLTLFFLPLLVAGLHTIFAFGLISKLLLLFGPMDVWFLALVAIGCFVVYAIVYVLLYTLTSKSYYKIVSD